MASHESKTTFEPTLMTTTPSGNIIAIARINGQVELLNIDMRGIHLVDTELPMKDHQPIALAFNVTGRYLICAFDQSEAVIILDTHSALLKVGQFVVPGQAR